MRLPGLLGVLALLLAGCISIYSPEVQQGNVVGPEMVERLKPGMTRSQVRAILGTPLVSDPFHPDRWDYVYSYRPSREAPAEQGRLTVVFQGDALVRLEGGATPTPPAPETTPEESQPPAPGAPVPTL